MSALLRLISQAFSLSIFREPRSSIEPIGFGAFLGAAGFSLACFMLQDWWLTVQPTEFYFESILAHASYFFSALIVAWLSAIALRRRELWLLLAALLILTPIPWVWLWQQLPEWLPDANDWQLSAWRLLIGFVLWVVLLRIFRFLAHDASFLRRLTVGALCWFSLIWPWQTRQDAWFWYPAEEPQEEEQPQISPTENLPLANPDFIMAQQKPLLDQALGIIKLQAPGKIDLFTLGFAGDGSENVFRNEVEYFSKLMALRFAANNRSVSLINHSDTVLKTPLATRSNLHAALAGIAARMNTSEDILFLFLTSHGSRNHELAVDMAPLPLKQITPDYLRSALDDSGIRWRVIVVSACYSGGFVDALRDPYTLVITAARADRPSFGCGDNAKITWFGKAFLTQALNQTTDFEHAFAIASKQIREWELAEEETSSVPQMVRGELISAKLAAWRERLPPTDSVVFMPAGKSVAAQRNSTPVSE